MSAPSASGLWQEARNAEGRVYYYNTQTKATQWTKPAELMSPQERALSNQPWKEYTADGGRKYWYNTETKSSSWEMPQAYKDAVSQTSIPARPPPPSQTFVAGGSASLPAQPQAERQSQYGYSETNVGVGTNLSSQDPDYSSFEEAEAAFRKLLRRAGVHADWSWEQAMRATIKDPQYHSLKDPRERQAAFEKFVVEIRAQEKDREKERVTKLRQDFGTMLRRHPEIKHYTRWKTARPIIERETIFRSTNDEGERRQLFAEYISELKKAHMEHETVARKGAMDELVSILKGMDLEPYTRWSDAQIKIQKNDRFQSDEKFQTLSKSEILTAFENHIKSLERSFNDARQREKSSKARRERQHREQYLDLLKDLRSQGKINAVSKWMQICPLIEEDERYTALLGQSGSTPLDIFWDMVEEEERGLRDKRNVVLDLLDDVRYEINPSTSFDEFLGVVNTSRKTAQINKDELKLIFERLREKVLRRNEDDKYQAERNQRKAVEAFRSRLKHLEPPILHTDSWEMIRPRVQELPEFGAIESDEARESAFEKTIRRLKEREEDAERERHRREKDRRSRESSYRERDRDRDVRNGYSHRRRGGRGSRSPETDAYEADRRRAQADRERTYRKTSKGPERERERERDRHDRRGDRLHSHYDRERREREEERERLYRTRGDPKGSRDELDYGDGDSSASGARKTRRRESEDATDATDPEARRDSKRVKRDDQPSRKADGDRMETDKAVHSGSEEGEIEEE